MQSLSKYNKGTKYLLCAIDFFSKYAWVVPIKHKKKSSQCSQLIKDKCRCKCKELIDKGVCDKGYV